MKTILSIRHQWKPYWIIFPNGSSINLDLSPTEKPDGSLDFETDIKSLLKSYPITHIKDENWIDQDMDYIYEVNMTVDDYLKDRGY